VARIVTEHLAKVFPGLNGTNVCALTDVSLTVGDNEWLVLAGPSGCGKTTLLRLIAGLETPTSGSVLVNGENMAPVPAGERDVAMVFQNPALYPHLTAYENLGFGLRIRRCPKEELDRRVRSAAAMLGITDCLDRKPMALSGGQRQRIALGRALVRRPQVFLFDEPLANLDAPNRGQLRTELLALRDQLGTTAIYVTHDQHEAMTTGHKLGVLNRGVLQQFGTPQELYEHPANMFVARFLGWPPINLLNGDLTQTAEGVVFQRTAAGGQDSRLRLHLPLVHTTRAPARRVALGIRPDTFSCDPGRSKEGLEGVIQAVENVGSDSYVTFTSAGETIVARLPPSFAGKPQQLVQASFDPRRVLLFDAQTQEALG
jgi:multiple sugar transport system ATP-binding protein